MNRVDEIRELVAPYCINDNQVKNIAQALADSEEARMKPLREACEAALSKLILRHGNESDLIHKLTQATIAGGVM